MLTDVYVYIPAGSSGRPRATPSPGVLSPESAAKGIEYSRFKALRALSHSLGLQCH